MRSLIVGNWKMNGVGGSLAEIAAVAGWVEVHRPAGDVLICPPFTLVAPAVATAAGRVAVGGQDCHPQPWGAFTGDVSAEMLADAGAAAVIVGHSERRRMHHETDALVMSKAEAAGRAGLVAILCVGESEAERDAGQALDVIGRQLGASLPPGANSSNTVLAYEPVWAIGSGRTPSLDEIVQMHSHIRDRLEARLGSEGERQRILYGGSVKPANAAAILALPDVNGALVGGASLMAAEFQEIVAAVAPRA